MRFGMGRDRALWVIAAGLVVSAMPVAAEEAAPRPFLRKVIQLDDAQLAAVEKGEVVTKLLETTGKEEIAAFGVVKTAGDPARLLKKARDVQNFRKVPEIPEMGLFSSPPQLSDLKGLTHPPDDIEALKKCKPGDCPVKVGTTALDRVAKVNWKADDAEAQAVALLNQAIIDFVSAYAKGGTDALGGVVDKKAPKSRSQEYRTLLANSPYLVDYVKEFNDHLASYPESSLEGAEEILYWTKDNFGLKPVVSARHMTLYSHPRGALIADKLLAASHYFNAALEITAGVPTADGRGMYLMTLFRTRLDPPTGMLAGVLAGKVRDGIETGVRENLKRARQHLASP